MTTATIKACGGDRVVNIHLIAAAIARINAQCYMQNRSPTLIEKRKVDGYCEQLRIIASELPHPQQE